jgi:ribosome biogenesis GTPase A|tara:strand:+ start:76007 stop:76843 length:837 start_codon:yes stop_codon:yes gene_type:complete
MAINWYPGHMNKARKELSKIIPTIDLVIELLDSRAPNASKNPLLDEITASVPRINVLSKADLADPAITKLWQTTIDESKNRRCLVSSTTSPLRAQEVIDCARKLISKETRRPNYNYQILITGIPNVGKSTLLNVLSERKLAKTGNEPAVTQRQQRIKLAENWYLIDTPGMMWPKLEDQDGAYRLAMTGTIRNTAVEAEDIAWFAAEELLSGFRAKLSERYGIAEQITTAEQVLESIAVTRGAISKRGQIDWHKTAEILLNDFRSGKLGRISLERPKTL